MIYDLSKFKKGLKDLSIHLNDLQIQQFIKYYELLIEKNRVMNLTTITEFDEVIEKHFLDSLSLVKVVDLNKYLNVIDLGTGAGFPGIPLKIAFPNLNILLMDSLNKRILFLVEVINELNLNEITAIHGRAEEVAGKREFREKFDLCVSRAVANLASLSEYCLPFIKINGSFISYKSDDIENELEQAKKAFFILGGEVEDVIKFKLPGTEMKRSLIKITKKKKTPKAYPRKPGTPGKSPIL